MPHALVAVQPRGRLPTHISRRGWQRDLEDASVSGLPGAAGRASARVPRSFALRGHSGTLAQPSVPSSRPRTSTWALGRSQRPSHHLLGRVVADGRWCWQVRSELLADRCALTDRVAADVVDLARDETSGHAWDEPLADEIPRDCVLHDGYGPARVARVERGDACQ